MATTREWWEGARPRTLPAAIAPIAVGAGLGAQAGAFDAVRVLLALGVAVLLQVGVNYANDYSDGVRGTDAVRVGPVRLVGQGLAPAAAVKRAAVVSLAAAAVLGLILVALTGQWWLLLVGAASIAAAWLYTGGPRPYGYAGLGEIFVFVFFGLVPVVGTAYVQTLVITAVDILASIGVGLLSCAILVTNNLRDIPGDTEVGKRTLAVRLGDDRTRMLYATLVT
ncbi:MAG TPA: 1,4-dihydroxy-2-naphthoate polyprenyltransferase, partial [Actinobacteria bacterium]|nr:1,4-dihydroxy-2-naphthoate polyprenyltransferase [Actinomycetota bacterium]